MNNKKTKNKNTTKHLENAMFTNRVSSANDCTGYMPTLPEDNTDAENMSELLNVPTSRVTKRK